MSPWESPHRAGGSPKSYERLTAAILPTRDNSQRGVPVKRPTATCPPNLVANASNFQKPQPNVFNNHQQMIYPRNYNQQKMIIPTNVNPPTAENMVVYNNAPLMIQIPPIGGRKDMPQQDIVTENQQLLNFPLIVESSSNLLLIPSSERQIIPNCNATCCGFLQLVWKMLRPNSIGNFGRVSNSNRLRWRDSEGPRCKVPCIH